MIKIIAAFDNNGVKKTKSFTSKHNRQLTMYDIKHLYYYIEDVLVNYGKVVDISYKVTFDNVKQYQNFVSAMSGKDRIISPDRQQRIMEHILNQININIK